MRHHKSYSDIETKTEDYITEQCRFQEATDQDELIEIDRFLYDSRKMILSDADLLDIIHSGDGFLTEEARLSRLFNYIRTDRPHDFRKTLSDDKSIINQMFRETYLLHEACRRGAIDIVTFLLFSDAECHISDLNGMYPQHCAAQSQSPILIDILSVFGHDLNIQDSHGNTPLHYAALNSDKSIVHMLINYKVKILKNNEGLTPIDICDDPAIKSTLTEYQNR